MALSTSPHREESREMAKAAAKELAKQAAIKGGKKAVVVIGWKPILIILAILAILGLLIFGAFILFLMFVSFDTGLEDQWDSTEYSGVDQQYISKYMAIYQAASKKYGVPWNIIAAIHRQETSFSTNEKMVSSVGAIGHTQFMECTWVGWRKEYKCDKYGNLGVDIDITDPKNIKGGYGVDANGDGKADPYDIEDAIFSTANYLAANSSKGFGGKGGAVWHYNHDMGYVNEVMAYADKLVTGGYGAVNQALASMSGQFAPPIAEKPRITSPYGMRYHPVQKRNKLHTGVDFGHPQGTPIYAAADGVVTESRPAAGYGYMIVIDHGKGVSTLYAHMYPNQAKVRKGNRVKKGQQIAAVGNNGFSTGPHLHFEVLINGTPADPMKYLSIK